VILHQRLVITYDSILKAGFTRTSKESKNGGLTEMNHAPASGAPFVKDSHWARTFILTITHEFYITHEPFLDWSPESTVFLAMVQHVFNLSFPNIVYTISAHDHVATTVCAYLFGQPSHMKLISQAYDRIKTRKSKIASSVLEVVQKFFDKAAFRDKPEKIRKYVHWALRPDGPVYYERPTPQECRADQAHSDYVVSFMLVCNGTVFDMISAT
jgi:hypothetical protein